MLQGRKSKLAQQGAAPALDAADGHTGAPRVTSRVGADLRAARERVGWTLPSVAAHLRIRLPFLEAIEEGRIGDLPGNAYAVGFLRTYAQSLGLDPDEIARRFKAEAAEVNRKTELAFPAPVPERGVPAGAVVLVGAVIAIGAYIGWYRMSSSERPGAEMVQAVPERLAPLAATAAPSPAASPAPGPSPAVVQPTPAQPASGPRAVATASIPAPPVPGAPPSGSPPAGASFMGPPVPAALLAGAAAPGASPAVAFGPPVPPALQAQLAAAGPAAPPPGAAPGASSAVALSGMPDGTRIVLRAKSDAWMQVREKQGPVLLNRVLRSGETWPVPPGKAQLLLTTGNAAGTELLVDGAAAPPLGGDGTVRRDLPLDPEMIRDGKLALGPPSAAAAKPGAAAPAIRTN